MVVRVVAALAGRVVVAAVGAVLMTVVMAVMVVAVVVGVQEGRIDLELGVEVEAAQVEHVLDRHDAEVDAVLRCARVHVLDAVRQRIQRGGVHQVGLAQEDLVGEAHLAARLLAGVELAVAVLGVDQRQDRVEQEALGDLVVHEEGLRDRARIGQAGGLDDDAVEVQLALAALLGQRGQRRAQVLADRAADAAVAHLDDLLLGVGHEDVVVDVLLAELVLDDGDALAVRFGEHALEQRRLARAEKAGQDGRGNEAVGHGGQQVRGKMDGRLSVKPPVLSSSGPARAPLRPRSVRIAPQARGSWRILAVFFAHLHFRHTPCPNPSRVPAAPRTTAACSRG